MKKRYQKECPNEIGIFLGYPIEDVEEFYKNPKKQCLMFGYWKVYFNEEFAREIFSKYDLCREETIDFIDKVYCKI